MAHWSRVYAAMLAQPNANVAWATELADKNLEAFDKRFSGKPVDSMPEPPKKQP